MGDFVHSVSHLKNFLIISRANIQIATLPHATLGLFLAASSIKSLLNTSVVVYVALYFTLITFACNINCLYDREVDRHYKSSLYRGVESLGVDRVKILIALEAVLSFLLIFFLYSRGHLITASLSFIGFLAGFIYSASPPRVKAKGFLSPFPVLIGLYTLPVLGGWFLLQDDLPFYFIVFTLGYAFMNEGFTLVNTCEDYSEDEKEGVKTWAHILGLKRTLNVAFIFTLAGLGCIVSLLYKNLALESLSDSWGGVALVLIGLSLFTLGMSALDVWRASRGENLELSAKAGARKMPRWFITTRYPLMFSALSMVMLQ